MLCQSIGNWHRSCGFVLILTVIFICVNILILSEAITIKIRSNLGRFPNLPGTHPSHVNFGHNGTNHNLLNALDDLECSEYAWLIIVTLISQKMKFKWMQNVYNLFVVKAQPYIYYIGKFYVYNYQNNLKFTEENIFICVFQVFWVFRVFRVFQIQAGLVRVFVTRIDWINYNHWSVHWLPTLSLYESKVC